MLTAPQSKRVFLPASEVTSQGALSSLYAQDHLRLGSRWTLGLGLRLDRQRLENDVGETVNSHTKLAPRTAASYDVKGDGRLVLRATAGRHYRSIPLDIATREFGRLPNGANVFDEFAWNPASGRYDRFLRRSSAPLDTAIQSVEPYFKDEISLGADWQADATWTLGTRLTGSAG